MRFHSAILFILLLGFLFSLIPTNAVDFTVGVSPQVVELGETERGTTKIVKFYLVTPSTEPLLVYLEPERGNIDFFGKDKYKNLIFNYSEEDTVSWIEFLKNPVELAPSNETLKTVAGEIRGWREVSFLLNIPNEADPGYHVIKVKPVPSIPSEIVGQAGARVVAITSVSVLFNVPGDAIRDGLILDVTPGNYIGNRLEINTYFQNVGTITIMAKGYHNFFNSNISIINTTSSLETIRPGEVKTLKSFLPPEAVSFGDYDVYTTVSYTTSQTTKNSTISIPPPPVIIVKPEGFPWWLVILVILIIMITIFIYKWYK